VSDPNAESGKREFGSGQHVGSSQHRAGRNESNGPSPSNAGPPQAGETNPAETSDRRLGEFRLLRLLGGGGMAEVWLAEQPSLGRNVAVKVLRPEFTTDEAHLRRFAHEARAAGGLSHPHIVQVYSIGEQDGTHYIAQEYVPGVNLNEFITRKGPPTAPVALKLMRQIAQALSASGQAGIVHRDIKPENILITRQGVVKVADFGLAQLTLAGERVHLTQDGITMGTPMYMSPEQINGRELDARSDIYSFGVTCYHMLCGRAPFRGATALSLAVQHLNEEPPPLERRRADLPPALCLAVHKMMAKKPDDRYPNAETVLNDLNQIAQTLTQSSGSTAELSLSDFDFAIESTASHTRTTLTSRLRRPAVLLPTACLLAGLSAAVVGRVSQPADPFAEPAPVSVSRQDSVLDQYYFALSNPNDERGWRAVAEHFPEDSRYLQLAQQQLLRLYLQDDRFGEALELCDVFVNRSDVPMLQAKGLTARAVIASVRGRHSESQRIIEKDLQPFREHLDESDRELVLQTISENRTHLDGSANARANERFNTRRPGTNHGE